MLARVLAYIREHRLVVPGDRLGIAVSGGADSVALLRILVELGHELGAVLSIVHFNHRIRGAESDHDERFVQELGRQHDLMFHVSSGDAPAHALASKQSLETAARELRYRYFRSLSGLRIVDKIATAHTMDDQAETVLLRLLRGAGTRGLAGIYPARSGEDEAVIVRPMLAIRHGEVKAYLRELGQSWREDETNADTQHTRNRIRKTLLPGLVRDYNPKIVETLARTAEMARAEETYWQTECARLLPFVLLPGKPVRGGGRATPGVDTPSCGLSMEALRRQPEALQRRLVRMAAESLGVALDLEQVDQVLGLLSKKATACQLTAGWVAKRSFRELRLEFASPAGGRPGTRGVRRKTADYGYEYRLAIPGEVKIPEINSVVRARLVPGSQRIEEYNHSPLPGETRVDSGTLLRDPELAALRVRNWRAGDRFWPAHSSSEKKIKELLQDLRLTPAERHLWAIVASGDRVIWVRGLRPREIWIERNGVREALALELDELAG